MVIKTGGILDDRGDPNRGEAEGFDVVHLLDETLKVAAPWRIIVVGAGVLIPALGIIGPIAIIETGRDAEIDLLIPEVLAGSGIGRSDLPIGSEGYSFQSLKSL
jgi:hypothetical protein